MRSTKKRYRYDDDQGIALLLALLFIVLLAALITDFMYKIHVEASLVTASNSDHEAYLAAKSGIATAMSVLHADRIGDIEDNGASTDTGTEGAIEVGGIYDGLDEAWAQPSEVSSFNDDIVNITISDEYGKINLNALIFETTSGEGLEEVNIVLEQILRDTFMLYLGLEEDPTDLILDWLDSDDNPRAEGAESDYYESLDPPFSCKNGPMDSIEELLLLPGITPELYFGLPSEEEQQMQTQYDEDLDASGPPEMPLFQIFTVHGHPEGKININTSLIPGEIMASVSVAQDLPEMGIDDTLQRLDEEDPFVSEEELRAQPYSLGTSLINPDIPQNQQNNNQNQVPVTSKPLMFTTESNVFRILSDAQSNGAEVRIEAYVFRDPSDNSNPEPQLFRILDWRVIR